MYACPACNRSAKNDSFPLDLNSIGAVEEDRMFATEQPMLLNPYTSNFVEHIKHVKVAISAREVQWRCFPRNSSQHGRTTIEVLKLNRNELLELRNRHYENHVAAHIEASVDAIKTNDAATLIKERDLLISKTKPKQPLSAFTFDIITQLIPDPDLKRISGKSWPSIMDLYR
jgi:hypothetical protein